MFSLLGASRQPLVKPRIRDEWRKRGLKFCLLPSVGLRDLASGEVWTKFGSGVLVVPTGGVANASVAVNNNASFGGVYLQPTFNLAGSTQSTHVLFTNANGISGGYGGLFAVSSTTPDTYFAVQDGGSGSGPFGIFTDNSTFQSGSLPLTFSASVVSVVTQTGSCVMRRNGVVQCSVGLSPTTRSNTRIVIGGDRGASASFSAKVKCYLYLGFDKALSLSDLNALRDNPWQVFESEDDAMLMEFFTAGGSPSNVLMGQCCT